ncbi:LacI family DNA-binding transcriptional regulator [Microlunatus parietis]|uniref:DNA-binding LacI/PurR family transcriptional regulator n=1 Tax=Microlunatus parietis TaxID=682979 RepID=A0A7Y9I8R5_9ACTN|nr:LacI family DNA-binding transcriptional regulator [Microlunatus parietis]NYE72081.1 DNA-binding LacI/PurR family transcriptional regulator [Microlunatus parietis]
MSVTLRDVALDAGVSVRTVSNVVSGTVRVAPDTRSRVEASLQKLGYRPNVIARNLRQGRTGLIGLAFPELDVPYFAELARAIVRASREHGLTVVIEQTEGREEHERALLDGGARGTVFDGLILSSLALGADEIADLAGNLPIVMLGERAPHHRLDHVGIDNVAAARVATEHLVSLGRSRIAAIGYQHPKVNETAHLRARGYEDALADAGLPVDRSLCAYTDAYHREDGAQAIRRLLDLPSPPDAVFCFNDLLALGAMRAALAHGVRIPQDLAIVGFDDIEDGRYSTPTLTTIVPDKEQIALVAVEMLLARLSDDPSKAREHLARFELAVRESTVRRRRRRG